MSRITGLVLAEKKSKNQKITMLTAYDYATAASLDAAGIDVVLVGDSLGMVVLGYENTLPVSMEEMLHHSKAVARAVKKAMVVADMPFLSYHITNSEAVRNAGRFIQEAAAQAVKVEGGKERVATIKAILEAQIPVMGHIGLTPQSVHQLGGFKVQGKDLDSAKRLIEDAEALEAAGVFALVLECVPAALAKLITSRLSIPTIGIGAGVDCDGQVLVINDILGLYQGKAPKFSKKYLELGTLMLEAIKQYKDEVIEGTFPAKEHTFAISDELIDKLY